MRLVFVVCLLGACCLFDAVCVCLLRVCCAVVVCLLRVGW